MMGRTERSTSEVVVAASRRIGWWLFAVTTFGLGPIMWECLDPEDL